MWAAPFWLLACGARAPDADGVEPASRRDLGEEQWVARLDGVQLASSVLEVAAASDPGGSRTLRHFYWAETFRRLRPRETDWLHRLALARIAADDVADTARQRGAPTDEELRRWTAAHWLTVDRPRAFRTVHALVLLPSDASAAQKEQARALAEAIRTTVADASTLEAFKAKAAAVPSAGFTVKIEELEPVAEDGRVVRLGAKSGAVLPTYDSEFAKAAAALTDVGATSPVTGTPFGFHVLRLLEVVPELRVDQATRRRLAEREVWDERAAADLKTLLDAGRAGVEVERSAEEATGRVTVE